MGQPLRRAGRGRRPLAGLAALCLGAALFAAAEIGAGLLIGRFLDWGRAEALILVAFRPWLLLIAAMRMAAARWQTRYLLYALALIVAGLSETLLLAGLGAASPWPEMLRGWAAGAMLAVIFDLAVQAGCRFGGKRGKYAATIALALLLLVPGALRPYEAIVLGGAGGTVSPDRPAVTVMTSLPIVWGEKGALGGGAPSASWLALGREFTLRPIDFLDGSSLGRARLMLLAQPRLLAPEELVAFDLWVRGGGRALILADPALAWPSVLPPGDVRRPVAINMLTPLLAHWRITVGPAVEGPRIHQIGKRQLRLAGAGTLASDHPGCRQEAPFVLDCRIGRGRAIIVADADLLHDSTSMPSGSASAERHDRLSDNVPAVADWLDRLAGISRERAQGDVQWADPGASRGAAVLKASQPIALALALALICLWLSRRASSRR